MQFGTLLRELIGLSGINQADLANELAFSTSELSKYVNGSRLPTTRNIRGMMSRSASLFAGRIWDQGLTNSMHTIFPLMHVPKDKAELTVFLRHALTLAYRESRIAGEEWTEGLNTLNMVLSGWEEIYHHLLISLSFGMRERKEDLHIHFTMDFFLAFIRNAPQPFPYRGSEGRVYVHVLLDEKAQKHQPSWQDLQLWLAHIEKARSVVSFKAWSVKEGFAGQSFCYVEGQYVMLLNGIVVNSPIGVRMEDTRFLMEFGLLNQMLLNEPLSYSREEAMALIRADREALFASLATCRGIYAFGNFGFLINRQHLDGIQAPDDLKDFLASVMHTFMHKPIPMLISTAAVDSFSGYRGTILPLLGWLGFAAREQVAYMAGFEELIGDPAAVRIRLSQEPSLQCAMIELEDGLLIYQPDVQGGDEQFLLLPGALADALKERLRHMISHETVALEQNLWRAYLKALPDMSTGLREYPASLWAPPEDRS